MRKRFSLFYHSLVSDWNHGNAHFLRGVVSELLSWGHVVTVYEPADGWSREQLISNEGPEILRAFERTYPQLSSVLYDPNVLDFEQVAANSDVVIVHEWNDAALVNKFGQVRESWQRGSNAELSFHLLFHDTHHRSVSDPGWIRRFELQHYDCILAFGEVLSDVYRKHGWGRHVWTWHEAADTRIFYPHAADPALPSGDLVWIGNWGDDERTRELQTFLFDPVEALGLDSHVYGVRYPEAVLRELQHRGIKHEGWLPNFRVPEVFANHAVTVHVPRRYYASVLPGIPTIRPFEAMACGIPLVCAPWRDSENLFSAGEDYLVARDSREMQKHLRAVLQDAGLAEHLAQHALATIREKHTCQHRVRQLLQILDELHGGTDAAEDTVTEYYEKEAVSV